jgi:hypothetical protein
MYTLDFSEYFRYDDLTRHLHGLAAAYPALASLQSLGKSWRGRDVWAMTLTNSATGADRDKPAFYIDAHIHAEEVATSHTALYTIWYLLTNYGSDPQVTWLLDNMAFYILPRTNPDGAEISLTTGHHWCGNGRYEPGEVGDGPYYRLYREGVIRGEWDGVSFEIEKPRDGNLNRNFPAGWVSEVRQYGAGEYPLSEPEALAVSQFLLAHPNISGMQCYHTHGGVHLRPSLVEPDAAIPPADLSLYKTIGAMATALTGYPTISVYEEFTPDPKQARTGSLMQWSYDEMGIITFSTELWNPELAAGIADPAKYQVRARSTEDELKLLAYNDKHLGGRGFIDWKPFDHPQLGRVEIGGWTHMYTFRNPPPVSWAATDEARGFLHSTIHTNCLFTLQHAATTPRVRIVSASAEALGADLYKVTAVVKNEGYQPTYMTQRALERQTAGSLVVRLDGADEYMMGGAAQDIGHLAGRDGRKATWSPWLPMWEKTTRGVEGLVRAPAGTSLTITASAPRAGTVHVEVQL